MSIFLKNTSTLLGENALLSQLLGSASAGKISDNIHSKDTFLEASSQALLAENIIKNGQSFYDSFGTFLSGEVQTPFANVEKTTSIYKIYTGSASRSPNDEIAIAFDLAREFDSYDYVFSNFFESEIRSPEEERLDQDDIANFLRDENIRIEIKFNPPIAVEDSYEVNEDTTLIVPNIALSNENFEEGIGVLSNDSDPDNDPLSSILVSDVSHGSLVFEVVL